MNTLIISLLKPNKIIIKNPENGIIVFNPKIEIKLIIVRVISNPFILFFNSKNRNSSMLIKINPEIHPKIRILVGKIVGTLYDSSFSVKE